MNSDDLATRTRRQCEVRASVLGDPKCGCERISLDAGSKTEQLDCDRAIL